MRRFGFGLVALAAAMVMSATVPMNSAFAKGYSSGGFSSGRSSYGGSSFSSRSSFSSSGFSSGRSSYGSSYSNGGSSYRSNGFSSGKSYYATPSTTYRYTPPPASTNRFTSNGFGSSKRYAAGAATVASAAAVTHATAAPSSARDRQADRQMAASAYSRSTLGRAERDRVMAATGGRTYTPSDIRSTRTVYVNRYYRDHYIPAYAYGGGSYGGYSNLFMYMMMYDVAFAHNHWNDPWYQQWYQQAQAQNNAQVQAQLASLQQQVNAQRGQPVDPNYMPQGVPPQVAYADQALTAQPVQHHSGWGWFWAVIGIALVFGLIWFFMRPRPAYA